MDELAEVLSPGVQHQGEADFAAEPARVAPEFEKGLGGGFEQQPVDDGRVALH